MIAKYFIPDDKNIKYLEDGFSTISFDENLDSLYPFEDKRSLGAMNRETLLMIVNSFDDLNQLDGNRDLIGIYAACNRIRTNSQVDRLFKSGQINSWDSLRRVFSPKMLFPSIYGINPCQLALHFKIHGPVNCFQEDTSLITILKIAKQDLLDNEIEKAIICASSVCSDAINNFLMFKFAKQIEESVAYLVISKDDIDIIDRASDFINKASFRYGWCSELISFIEATRTL